MGATPGHHVTQQCNRAWYAVKALLQSSSLFHEAKTSFAERGIMGTENLTMDFDKMMANKNGAVSKLTAGVEGLFKRDKVEYLKGHGKLTGPNSVTVTLNDGGEQQITAKSMERIMKKQGMKFKLS